MVHYTVTQFQKRMLHYLKQCDMGMCNRSMLSHIARARPPSYVYNPASNGAYAANTLRAAYALVALGLVIILPPKEVYGDYMICLSDEGFRALTSSRIKVTVIN